MNRGQRVLVIISLVIIATILSFTMLDWHDGWREGKSIFIFYEDHSTPAVEYWGLYTKYGVSGIVLGIVVPVCLLAIAAFIALGTRQQAS